MRRMPKREIVKHIRVCTEDHGGPHNAATVYGHYANLGNRSCLRLIGTDVWIYTVEVKG